MSTHRKSSLGGKKSSLCGKSTKSHKEERDLPDKVTKGKKEVGIPEAPLTEEEQKKMKAQVSLEYQAYQAEQRDLIASQKRRDDAQHVPKRHEDVKRSKRDRSHRRRRSPRSKGSSRHTGYVSIESSSSSPSEEADSKRARRSVISPHPAEVERKEPGQDS